MKKNILTNNAIIAATVAAALTATVVATGSPFDWKTIVPCLVGGVVSAFAVALTKYLKSKKNIDQ